METIYYQRANGRWEFWVYSDSSRISVTRAWAIKENRRGARMILVNH